MPCISGRAEHRLYGQNCDCLNGCCHSGPAAFTANFFDKRDEREAGNPKSTFDDLVGEYCQYILDATSDNISSGYSTTAALAADICDGATGLSNPPVVACSLLVGLRDITNITSLAGQEFEIAQSALPIIPVLTYSNGSCIPAPSTSLTSSNSYLIVVEGTSCNNGFSAP